MKYYILIILFLSAFNALGFAQDTLQILPRYHRNDTAYLEQYKAENKQKYFPLVQSTYGVGIWTELNPKVPRVDYIGIDFVNPDTGWAVGLYGAVIKTTNGGTNWQTIDVPTGEILLKVHSYNGQVVIVVGHNGTILRSDDGGNTFTSLSGITTQELWGVKMLNDTLGWICGRNQTLLKTTDSGLTWQNISTGYNYHYWSFDFFSNDNFMIACNFGKILKTTNGGINWTIYQAGNIEDLFTIDIIDSIHIAAAGSYGKNVYSSDGGINWIENTTLTASPLNWIQFINSDTGYAVVESAGLFKTTNRGLDWFEPGFNDAGDWQFELLNNNLAYSVGAELTVTKTEDEFMTGRNLFLNKNWSDVYFINESKGFLSSSDFQTQLYKTTDGGGSFQIVDNSPARNNDILFLDSLTGYLCSNSIYKTNNGGENWYATSGASQATKIFFTNAQIGWFIGGRSIYKTIDGGENWLVQFIHPSVSFTSIYMVDSSYGWTTILSSRPYKTTDGGENWSEQTNLDIWESDDVYFPNRDSGWIARYSAINTSLFKTTDGGNTWIEIPEVIGARKFRFTQDPNHWLIIGFERYYMTYDNGNTWYEFTNEVPTGLTSFSLPTNNIGYAVGTLGLVLKYEDTTYVPVELTSFTSSVYENDITLNWQTATETNNQGFEVQRKQVFSPQSSMRTGEWDVLSFVTGNGTTTETQTYTFMDKNLTAGKYQYRLKQIDYDGTFKYSNNIEVEINAPAKFSLEQNYPNPFNPSTTISFSIPMQSEVIIELYDITGQKITELTKGNFKQGTYFITINLSNLSSGVYIYRMITDQGYSDNKKLTIIK